MLGCDECFGEGECKKMPDLRTVEQKQDSSNDVRSDFHRGLEELMRGHLDDCMTLGSCSSTVEHEDVDEEGDQLVRRRRRSDIEGDDLAESSAARRRHSRTLSRWAARQAEEMFTTIERRNRESELMALAGLHTVSMLDSSFLRESESPTSRRQGGVERENTQASSLLQMWRELEDENVIDRARTRDRLRQQRSIDSNMLENRGNTHQAISVDASESESEYVTWSQGQVGSQTQNNIEVHQMSSREQSPDPGEVERERVRQIARGWMDIGVSDQASNVSQTNSPRAELLDENERGRVRLIREWVQMNSEQRGTRGGRRGEQSAGVGAQIHRVQEGMGVDHDERQPELLRRDLLRLRGRQALIDLLVRIERERQGELQGLLEHRAVSDFAHRNRIQSLLRGRFLRNGRSAGDQRPRSIPASELGLLRQRHTVSGLRDGFRARLQNIVRGQVSSHADTISNSNTNDSRNEQIPPRTSQEVQNVNYEHILSSSQGADVPQLSDHNGEVDNTTITWQEPASQREDQEQLVTEDEGRDWQHSNDVGHNVRQDNNGEEMDGNWQENLNVDELQLTPGNENEENIHIEEDRDDWHDDASQEAVDTWHDTLYDLPRTRDSVSSRRMNEFHPPDDENVYSMELRELVSRRSVSNLLHSGFRESLDQLIQSYVERQAQDPIEWDIPRSFPLPISAEQGQELQGDNQNVGPDTVTRPFGLSSPPVPPPPPLWHQELQRGSWSRHSMHRSEYEWEVINDLRADVASLQQGMRKMQRMLEACMDMQLELQRSVRQEVSAALNRSAGEPGVGKESSSDDEAKWVQVRKGTCCVCCDSQIDSLLYRCGHMCTCSKCASELVRGDGKCPMCRAPIIEVIRAYSIL